MSIRKPVDVPDVYRNAPDSEEEGEELLEAWRRRTISYREKLLRWAALGDRATLNCPPLEGKAQGSFRLEAFRLIRNDVEEGVTAAGPLSPHDHLDPGISTDELRAYVRQEYASWASSRT
ncbi:hypothetical protein QFZ66_008527 [Streptomyces sp. B4I13]|uniref:hypothetical protein n=1 Tax=Streptomyces sp. B4I13 TaxID=3042271 RepID=UPI00278964E6|nr:hypothetical protein [Streptomyces sp. B4I13]MDQ0964559.1 hypothetical protein [Streptomyces sp. B4I13]